MRRNSFVVFLVLFVCALPSLAQGRPLTYSLAAGDSLFYLAGNSVVDIEFDTVLGVPVVWVGTGSGASVSADFGVNWLTYTTTQGLNANSISALHLNRDTVWVGMAHSQDFNGDLFPVGDGFNYSITNGSTWDTTLPPQSTGIGYFSRQVFGMLPFDIHSESSGIWSACFFGGLIRSTDGGATWFNVFPSPAARSDFDNKNYQDLGNRYFSVTAGPVNAAGDTIEAYAGSAGGINRFLVIDAKIKLAGAPVRSIHTDRNGSFEWLGTGGGISRVARTTLLTRSYFDSTTGGVLPAGDYLSSASPFVPAAPPMSIFGAFTVDSSDTIGAGLVRTFNDAATWEYLDSAAFVGPGKGALDLLFTRSALWAAAGDAGLQRSSDYGTSWQRVYVDPAVTSPDSAINRVLSVAFDTTGSQLYVGTADGIYRLTLGGGDVVTGWESALYRYPAGDTTRGQVIPALSAFHNGSSDLLLWAASHASPADSAQHSTSLYSNDSGSTWQSVLLDLVPWQYAYAADTVFGATTGGLMLVELDGTPGAADTVLADTVVPVYRQPDSLELVSPFFSIVDINGTFWLGGDHGYARRIGAGPSAGNFNWGVYPFVPRDSVDVIQLTQYEENSDSSISGNFVIALAIQQQGSQRTVWASTRPVESPQFLGVSRSTDDGRTWEISLTDKITWNIDTYNEHVWAATSAGLYHTVDAGANWTHVPVVDTAQNTGFYEGTELLSVAQIDANTVLAGSEDGFARSADLGASWTITRSFVGLGTEAAGGSDIDVYASPVPFSPVTDTRVRLHYKPLQDGNVRIEIFDFAMQKVATVLNGEFRAGLPGPDPYGTNHYYEEWDATNDNGQSVATGVYFFRVETSGETQWGKLVILP